MDRVTSGVRRRVTFRVMLELDDDARGPAPEAVTNALADALRWMTGVLTVTVVEQAHEVGRASD